MRLVRIVAATGVLALAANAQQTPQIVGGVSSTAAVEIDGTPMAPAPSWPIVDRDVIRTTSAPGLILTTDQNAITLMQETTVRVRLIAPEQTWVFVRGGGLSVKTKNNSVLICMANRLFQPSAAASGSLILERSGTITRTVASGLITELPVSACGEDLPAGQPPSGPVAGGTASAPAPGGTTTASKVTTAAAIAASAGLAAAIGFATASGSGSCTSGCSFIPPSITPSVP